jgi:hypothetical protein
VAFSSVTGGERPFGGTLLQDRHTGIRHLVVEFDGS